MTNREQIKDKLVGVSWGRTADAGMVAKAAKTVS
jgi:hypothetical protein